MLSAFIVNIAIKLIEGNNGKEIKFYRVVSDTSDCCFDDDSYGIVRISSKPYGWNVCATNNSSKEEIFMLDINTNNIDMSKPCRIRLSHQVEFYELWSKQQDPSEFEKKNAWNYTSFRHRVYFDVLEPIATMQMSSEKIEMAWFSKETLSTPWLKHSCIFALEPGDSMNFSFEKFDITDIDMDGKTDSADLSIVLDAWGTRRGDINGDGTTDAHDSAMVLDRWRKLEAK